MIQTNNQFFSPVCVQLEDILGHPVLNGNKAEVQRGQVIVVFRVE